MSDLVDTMAAVLIFSGLCLFFVLPFASTWKAHYRKEKISPKTLTRHSLYLGIAVMVFGLGFILSTWQNRNPEAWLISKIITGLGCLVVFPLLMVSVYILDMRWGGYAADRKR